MGAGRFGPRYFPYGLIGLSGNISGTLNFETAVERDPVLRNRIRAGLGLDLSYVQLKAGLVLSPFNTPEKALVPGVEGALTFVWPGIIFGTFRGSSTLGASLNLPGEYIQETGELELGFWVPNVVCSVSFGSASFSRRLNETLIVRDERTRAQFTANIYAKNVPYEVKVNMGYQNLVRSYSPAGAAPGSAGTDELRSFFLGFEGSWRAAPRLRIILGAEAPLYIWGKNPLKKPDMRTAFFAVHAGFVWTLPEKTNEAAPGSAGF
jgi:hypothetical protein